MKNLLSILKMDFVKINHVGRNLRSFSCLLSCLILAFGSSFQSLAAISSSSNAFAVNPDYLIGSASNADPYAIATMELTDEDYFIQPFSTVSSITNTVDYSGLYAGAVSANNITVLKKVNSDGTFTASSDESSVIDAFTGYYFRLTKNALPSPGKYRLEFDLSSDVSVPYTKVSMAYQRNISNSAPYTGYFDVDSFTSSSGDIYFTTDLNIENVTTIDFRLWFKNTSINQVGGLVKVRFTRLSSDASTDHTVGSGTTNSDYQSDVSGSLSDISSSIGDMSSSMDSAAESLEYISTSQNLIIQGIDNVIMHISDQLYAFWDQLYNLIHEPTYARLGDILDAIRNLDLEITVEMTEVTNAVNKMNQEVQNKLQQTTDKITGGYDSSVLESQNQQLESAVDEYDQSEQAILDSVEGNIEDFTYPSFDDLPLGTLGALGFFGGLMQSIFEGMGAFNMIITFSLTLVFVLILIGYHRIRN